jgi:hypothetical protein
MVVREWLMFVKVGTNLEVEAGNVRFWRIFEIILVTFGVMLS